MNTGRQTGLIGSECVSIAAGDVALVTMDRPMNGGSCRCVSESGWNAAPRSRSMLCADMKAEPAMKDIDEQKIVAAAILQNGVVCSIPRPARHHDIIRQMAQAGFPIPIDGKQGFVTDEGVFVSRELARSIADAAGQIITKNGNLRQLFSEDVW